MADGAMASELNGWGGRLVDLSFPLVEAERGELVMRGGASALELRGAMIEDLVQARFIGCRPEMRVVGGKVSLRQAPRLGDWLRQVLTADEPSGMLTLNDIVPWDIVIQGGVSNVRADLRGLSVRSVQILGGASRVELLLPSPEGRVPIRIYGGASHVTLSRPVGDTVSLEVQGGASHLQLDDTVLPAVGGPTRLVSGESAQPDCYKHCYDVEISGGAHRLTVTARSEPTLS